MTVRLERILSSEEFQEINNNAMDSGLYNTDPSVFKPGMCWQQNWYYDPTGLREKQKQHVMFTAQDREDILSGKTESNFLSMHYWKDWSHIRPPVCVILPNYTKWEIDRVSRTWDGGEGLGWKVTGFFPLITCSPSINVIGYHGNLVRGIFSADIEGRGPNGVLSY